MFLLDGFTNGFPLGYKGETENIRRDAPNLHLDCRSQEILWEKIMKEIRLKCFAGPFDNPPFKNYIQSPIGLVSKGENGTRLIFHLLSKGWGVC